MRKDVSEMDPMETMLDLSRKGYYCALILMILALQSEGKENPDLVRTMGGLHGGLGNSGGICGCLTGLFSVLLSGAGGR